MNGTLAVRILFWRALTVSGCVQQREDEVSTAMREKRKASGTATPAQRPAQTGGAAPVQAVSDRPVRNGAVRT